MWIAFFKIQQDLFFTLAIYIYNYYWIDISKLDADFCQSFSEKIKKKDSHNVPGRPIVVKDYSLTNVIERDLETSS